MIVDVHTHLPTHRDSVPDSDRSSENMMRSGDDVSMTNTIADYLRAMEPVDKTFAFGIAPRPEDSAREMIQGKGDLAVDGKNHNDVAAELHKAAPDKVIPFMSLHPRDPGMNDEYDRAVGDLGCKGIKLGPNYQNFDPVGESLRYEILTRDRVCQLCGATREQERLEVDHIVPRSKGGTNDPDNLQVLCAPCNRGKSNRDDTDFRN